MDWDNPEIDLHALLGDFMEYDEAEGDSGDNEDCWSTERDSQENRPVEKVKTDGVYVCPYCEKN